MTGEAVILGTVIGLMSVVAYHLGMLFSTRQRARHR